VLRLETITFFDNEEFIANTLTWYKGCRKSQLFNFSQWFYKQHGPIGECAKTMESVICFTSPYFYLTSPHICAATLLM